MYQETSKIILMADMDMIRLIVKQKLQDYRTWYADKHQISQFVLPFVKAAKQKSWVSRKEMIS
jgi:hypothetical protein